MSLWGIQSGSFDVGASGAVAITDKYTFHSVLGGPATSKYKLQSDGAAYYTVAGVYDQIVGEWLLSGLNSDYECRMTTTSGDALSTGTTGSWLALTSTREWTLTATGVDKLSFNTLEIRRVSDSVVVATAQITFDATGAA